MKSRFISIILTFIILFCTNIPVLADNSISVYINGEKIQFDVPPTIINGRTMVPMRAIFEALGAIVSWDAPSQTATGKKGDTVVNVSINSKTLFKNSTPITLDTAPTIINSRTLVPARAIAESFDCGVEWISETKTVEISTLPQLDTKKQSLTASEISEKVAPSVFFIAVYDEYSELFATGSGFFISSEGVAVTNHHVIKDSYSAQITTIDGDVFDVTNIIAFDEKLDIAIIRISKTTSNNAKTVSGFPSVTLSDSDKIKAGQTIYALGSPKGLQNTISNGIISNVNQTIGEDSFIQITAAISSGSSGGALVDEYGCVLGITSAKIEGGENIGLSIPINVISLFDLNNEGIPYSEFSQNNPSFSLELSKSSVSLNVGESADIYVYADGKGDWSIYWESDSDSIISCSWGDWLKDNNSVCPLTITGLAAGTSTITVYSDVDFKGKEITVYVKQPSITVYPGTNIPSYSSFCGMNHINRSVYDSSIIYSYDYSDIYTVTNYENYLISNGYTLYDTNTTLDDSTYYYILPNSNTLMSVTITYKWQQVWIQIPR